MMWWNDDMSWGGWTAMIVLMLAFWALVIFGLMTVFGQRDGGKQQTRPPSSDPQEILRERFARGEIDADDYHARQEVLRTHE